ncbi:hypothetical protein Lal_00022172 [Lupinus albus]|nr:hypothetical protein Lal_00022172 [Lupinus albus]
MCIEKTKVEWRPKLKVQEVEGQINVENKGPPVENPLEENKGINRGKASEVSHETWTMMSNNGRHRGKNKLQEGTSHLVECLNGFVVLEEVLNDPLVNQNYGP